MSLIVTLALIAASQKVPSQASLVAAVSRATPGKPFAVAVRLKHQEGWHSYWRNPGDSGSPTTVTWRLPKGWKVSEPQWPVPHRIPTEDIVSFGYENESVLLFQVTPSSTKGPMVADVRWLVCRHVCLMAKGKVQLNVPLGPTPVARNVGFFDRWQRELPVPIKELEATATIENGGYRLRLDGSDIPASVAKALFYPLEGAVLNHAPHPAFRALEGGAEVFLARSPYAVGSPARLQGVLVLPTGSKWSSGSRGLVIDAPVQRASGENR